MHSTVTRLSIFSHFDVMSPMFANVHICNFRFIFVFHFESINWRHECDCTPRNRRVTMEWNQCRRCRHRRHPTRTTTITLTHTHKEETIQQIEAWPGGLPWSRFATQFRAQMGEEFLSGRYIRCNFVFVRDFVVAGLIAVDIGIDHRSGMHFDWLRIPTCFKSDFQTGELDGRPREGIRRGVRRIVNDKGQSMRPHQAFVRTKGGKNHCRE